MKIKSIIYIVSVVIKDTWITVCFLVHISTDTETVLSNQGCHGCHLALFMLVAAFKQ